MAKKNKTQATSKSLSAFIDSIQNETRRDEAYALVDLYKDVTGLEPVLWGPSIIGFGQYHYRYASGHEGDMPRAAFSPRKNALVLYLLDLPKKDEFLAKLGKHKATGSCVYVRKLEEVDLSIVKKMILASMKSLAKKYPPQK